MRLAVNDRVETFRFHEFDIPVPLLNMTGGWYRNIRFNICTAYRFTKKIHRS